MIQEPPRSTTTDTFVPYTTLFRAHGAGTFSQIGPLEKSRRDLPVCLWRAGVPHALSVDVDDPQSWPNLPPNLHGLTIIRMRSEEHTSELQSLMRISYAVFCLKKKLYKLRQHKLI